MLARRIRRLAEKAGDNGIQLRAIQLKAKTNFAFSSNRKPATSN